MSVTRDRSAESYAGPLLSDGTSVASLINLDRKTASLRLFSDPEVYEAEKRYLFGRCWNIVAHASEIPDPGDYVMRRIAGDSVIVTRDRDGEVSVLLNVCAHRGMQVCRSEAGNASNFKCPYHGWVYGTEGRLLGAPFEREMYGTDLDKANLGLRRARVGVYAGIIFANWDPTAPALDEFLGEYSFYTDTIFKRTSSGLECVGAPQRFQIHANWKTASEQFNGADGYHAATLHRTLMESLVPDGDPAKVQELSRKGLFAVDIGSPMGHGLRAVARAYQRERTRTGRTEGSPFLATEYDDGRADVSALESFLANPPQFMPRELVPELFENLSEGQIQMMLTYPPFPGGMFPNVGFLHCNLRVHVPTGVDSFEMINWVLIEKDAPPEFKEAVRKEMLLGFGTSGTIEQDDSESWPSIQKSATGYQGSQQVMRYQAFVGHKPPEGWEGGAYVYEGLSKDDSAWNFWLRYRDYFTGEPL